MVFEDKFVYLMNKTGKMKKYDLTRGGIMYEVFKTSKSRYSEVTLNDPFFNRLCDLETQLPSVTYPINDPNSLHVIGVF